MENTSTNKESQKEELLKELVEDDWMVRSCDVYYDEYKDCRSIKARFHQYFVFGKSIDCSQWKRDTDNCHKWIDNKDVNAAKEVIKSERLRRLERLKGHYRNDVWAKRNSPPADWDKPLPDYLQKQYENSYLGIKSKEIKGEIAPQLDFEPMCTIM